MPTYEYECLVCHRRFEHHKLMEYKGTVEYCPICQESPQLIRIPSAPAFHLKGKGFHKNDYPTN